MKGDFSRGTFDRRHRFSRVLMQQGRVLLDADWNEQTAILLHYIRTLAADVIGPHAGPGDGFRIGCGNADGTSLNCDFTIGYGHYYVDGILVENVPPGSCPPTGAAPLLYTAQPDLPLGEDGDLLHSNRYLVYLDVWERHLTHLQTDDIREVALGGPDTATRARVVWQVRAADDCECGEDEDLTCVEWLARVTRRGPRCLRARARVPESSDDPCIIPPESRYRGAENQLYRVEIHDGGKAGTGDGMATFKWSRDNGSVVFAIRSLEGSVATVETLGPDNRRTLKEGDWVEIVDDRTDLRGDPGVMLRVDAIDPVRFEVTLAVPDGTSLPVFSANSTTHPLLRRWDQASNAIPVQEGRWIDIEDGVQIEFSTGGQYRTGDYWLIPARTATGDVLWPREEGADGPGSPLALPPRGIEHHYAALARIRLDDSGGVTCEEDCRCTFEPLCAIEAAEEPPPPPPAETRPAIDAVVADPPRTDACQDTAPVQFKAAVTGSPPLAHLWEFGDGQRSEGETPTHKFTTPGLKTVRLTVTNAAGSTSATVQVAVAPCERLEVEPVDPVLIADLKRIASVGDRRAAILARAGRKSVKEVAAMNIDEIRAALDVSETVATNIRKSARDLAPSG